MMADIVADMASNGGSKSQARRMLCALVWAIPRIPKPIKSSLPMAWAAVQGWHTWQPG